jgi:hypothetical protein
MRDAATQHRVALVPPRLTCAQWIRSSYCAAKRKTGVETERTRRCSEKEPFPEAGSGKWQRHLDADCTVELFEGKAGIRGVIECARRYPSG